MKTTLALAAAAAAVGAYALPATADAQGGRTARCTIAGAGLPAYRGACRFVPEGGGSFTVMPPRGGSFPGGVTAVSVSIAERGVAEVRGLTANGINSRWGTARRSSRDRACWVGADFSVCAY